MIGGRDEHHCRDEGLNWETGREHHCEDVDLKLGTASGDHDDLSEPLMPRMLIPIDAHGGRHSNVSDLNLKSEASTSLGQQQRWRY